MNENDFINMTENIDFVEERNNLDVNLKKIDEIIDKHQSDMDKNDKELNSIPSNDHEYGGYKRDLLRENGELRYKIIESKEAKKNPYFGRMNLTSNKEKIDMYIGEKGITDLQSKQIVYDWRAPVAGLFYQNQEAYKYNGYNYQLNLKRRMFIEDSKLLNCYNVYSKSNKDSKIVDEFLQTVLANKKDNANFVDIIKTIQSKQNDIIREDIKDNVIVQGVAGSGKTVIILHRLSYILYNNPNINPRSFMFIAPTNIFKDKLNELNKKLQIDEIPINTIYDYYNGKLRALFCDKVIIQNEKDEKVAKIVPYTKEVINDNYANFEYFVNKYNEEHYQTLKSKIMNKIEESIKPIYKIIGERKINYKEETILDHIKGLKVESDSMLQKLLSFKDTIPEQLEITTKELYDYLIKEFGYDKQGSMYNFIRFGDSESLPQMSETILKELNELYYEREKEIGDLEQQFLELKEYEKQITILTDKYNVYEKQIKELFQKTFSINKRINVDTIPSESYNIKYYNDLRTSLVKKMSSSLKQLERQIIEIENSINKKQKSIFKNFYRNKIQELLHNKENLSKQLTLEKETIAEFDNNSNEYYINELFEDFNSNYKSLNDYRTKADTIRKQIDSKNDNRIGQINILKRKLDIVDDIYNDTRKYEGIFDLSKINDTLCSCYRLIFNSYNKTAADNEFVNRNKLKEFLSSEDTEKEIEEVRLSVLDKIQDIMKPKFLWNLYLEYLKEEDSIAFENYYDSSHKKITRSDAYLLLRLSAELGYSVKKEYSYMYIDEAQDYNDSEIKTIYLLEGKPVLNIYGDINQRIFENVHERKNWHSLMKLISIKFNQHELNENYRNTIQIVDYCNKKLNLNMNPIGISLTNVTEIDFRTISDVILEAQRLNAVVITNNMEYIKKLEERDVKCYTVFQAKGLEFPDVIVIDENFSNNQKYVAYTRSLKSLLIFKTVDSKNSY
ncbi:MAG: hypothetical protein PHX40_03350 [Bacilli bacterium]|nr:hypothetical protein [Bacilli bacterium]